MVGMGSVPNLPIKQSVSIEGDGHGDSTCTIDSYIWQTLWQARWRRDIEFSPSSPFNSHPSPPPLRIDGPSLRRVLDPLLWTNCPIIRVFEWRIYTGKILGHVPLPNFLHLHAVFRKIWPNNRLAPPGKSRILTADSSVRYDEDVHVRRVGREDQADTGDDSPRDGHHATPVAVNQRARHRTCSRNVDVKYKQGLWCISTVRLRFLFRLLYRFR